MANQKRTEPKRDVVTLSDLAPSRDVRGGGGRQVFGATAHHVPDMQKETPMAGSKKTKDLSPAKNPKGGLIRKPVGNDNFTLVRAAKPAIKKDLSPKSSPKGGKKTR